MAARRVPTTAIKVLYAAVSDVRSANTCCSRLVALRCRVPRGSRRPARATLATASPKEITNEVRRRRRDPDLPGARQNVPKTIHPRQVEPASSSDAVEQARSESDRAARGRPFGLLHPLFAFAT